LRHPNVQRLTCSLLARYRRTAGRCSELGVWFSTGPWSLCYMRYEIALALISSAPKIKIHQLRCGVIFTMWESPTFAVHYVKGGSVVIRSLIGSLVLSICAFFAAAESIYGAENSSKTDTILERDWPGLEHYRLANSKTAPPLKGERRVVFFGDSITEFWNLSDYFAGMPYINRGVGGQTTSQMLIRFRPDVIALRPRTVVILAGTNDINRNHNGAILNVVRDNLSSMVELAQVHNIRVVLASLLPVNDYSNGKDEKRIRQTTKRRPEDIKILNEWIKRHAIDIV
jgi:hypothetical protein